MVGIASETQVRILTRAHRSRALLYEVLVRRMQSNQLAWLAGLIEADGYIGVHTRKNGFERYKIAVEMADEDVVRYCCAIAGVGYVSEYDRKPGKWKRTYKWQVQAEGEVVSLLRKLYPFIISSRKRAEADKVFVGYGRMRC